MLIWIKNQKPITETCTHKGFSESSRIDYDTINGFTILTILCDNCGNPILKDITKTKEGKTQNEKKF